MDHLCKKEKQVIDLLITNSHPKKELRDTIVVELDEFVDKIRYLINEILIAAKANNLSGDIIDQMKSTIQNKIAALPGLPWDKQGDIVQEYFTKLFST